MNLDTGLDSFGIHFRKFGYGFGPFWERPFFLCVLLFNGSCLYIRGISNITTSNQEGVPTAPEGEQKSAETASLPGG